MIPMDLNKEFGLKTVDELDTMNPKTKWIATHDIAEDGEIVATMMQSVDIPNGMQLIWHADPLYENRIFIWHFWWKEKKYAFQTSLSESWYHTISPGGISQSLLKEFLKSTDHFFEDTEWGIHQRRELVKWWEVFSGSVVGYHGKMSQADIEWFSGTNHSVSISSDFTSSGLSESVLTPISLSQTKGLDVSMAAMALPGMDSRVESPCGCDSYEDISVQLYDLVQHMNDGHKWSREKIADWLDELHDSGVVNLEFSPWGELEDESEMQGQSLHLVIEDEASDYFEQKEGN